MLAGTLISSTTRLDLYRIEGGLTITTLLKLAPQFEQAIDRVGARMGAHLSGRVALSFEPAQRGPCALRGLTLSHQRIIRLYYAPETPEQRVLAVVAHELAHELQHDYYGWPAHQKSDLILLEGQATWASGDYSLDAQGQPSWQSAAELALAEGNLLPLDVSLEADCRTATRNSAYTGWASFVAFLMRCWARALRCAVSQRPWPPPRRGRLHRHLRQVPPRSRSRLANLACRAAAGEVGWGGERDERGGRFCNPFAIYVSLISFTSLCSNPILGWCTSCTTGC